MLTDFPKLHCPYVRRVYAVDKTQWKEYGARLGLRKPEVYLAVNEINPGYEWVFEDPETFAVCKLNGTNVKIRTEKGRLVEIQNRLNPIDMLQICKGQGSRIVEGVMMACNKDYVKEDGEQAGELIGPKLQGNPYNLEHHLWYPFAQSLISLRYNCFPTMEKSFTAFEEWFKDLRSVFDMKRRKCKPSEAVFSEGVIFYNLRRIGTNQCGMAKLRRDMFRFFYEDKIDIIGYPNSPIEKEANEES